MERLQQANREDVARLMKAHEVEVRSLRADTEGLEEANRLAELVSRCVIF